MRKQINKNRDIILLTIGTLLIILSLCLLFYDRIELLKSNVFDEIEMEKYRENNREEEVVEEEEYVDGVETDDIESDDIENDENSTTNTSSGRKYGLRFDVEKVRKEFIGYLEIKKINLKQGLVSKKSYYNDVEYNIQMLSTSDYPDKKLGNVILAGHSGYGYLAFFKDLYKLSRGDEAKIYYKNYIYTYKVVNIYDVPKVGKVKINRDVKKSCLTLITCTHNSKTKQTVYILELTKKVKDGEES